MQSLIGKNEKILKLLKIFGILVLIFIGYQTLRVSYIIISCNRYKTQLTNQITYGISTDIADGEIPKIQKIPKKLHFVWKSKDLSGYIEASASGKMDPSRDDWAAVYTDYEIKVWTDEDVEQLVKEKYAYLWNLYKSYPHNVQRADLARYIVLHHEGGTYCDLDGYPGKFSLEPLFGFNLVIVESIDQFTLTNFFMMAEANSPALEYVLRNVHYQNEYLVAPYVYVMWTTGPLALTKLLYEYLMKNGQDPSILILKGEEVGRYVNHLAGRSWHKWDGWLISFVDEYRTPIIIAIVIAAVFMVRRIRAGRTVKGSQYTN